MGGIVVAVAATATAAVTMAATGEDFPFFGAEEVVGGGGEGEGDGEEVEVLREEGVEVGFARAGVPR